MIIGNEFNKKAKALLKEISSQCNGDIDVNVSVKDLSKSLVFDRYEIKNLLEYLENKDFIKIATIGGPYLYGHVSLTQKGLNKINS